jgi:succinoglycan biosynthesis protein ExoL
MPRDNDPTTERPQQPDFGKPSARRGERLAFFAPDFTEVSTVTRAFGFRDQGYDFTVFAFRRGRYNAEFESQWPEVPLGHTKDGKYLQRLMALVCALPVLWHYRHWLAKVSVFYARNVDQLMLCLLSKWLLAPQSRLVYEVLDIPHAFTGTGRWSKFLRWVERKLLDRISLLVVSSPGFLRNFYQPMQGYRGASFLLENKMHPKAAPAPARRRDMAARRKVTGGRDYKWVVGYFGLIRGQKTFDLITRLADYFSDEILFYFRGVMTTVNHTQFNNDLARHDNMVYGGPYVNPDDLAEIYDAVDLVWTIDLEHEDANSRWLLPCRLYEAGALGTPCIGARGFEVGNRIEALGAGWTESVPFEENLIRFFTGLTDADYYAARERLARLPRSLFVSDEDPAALARAIDKTAESPVRSTAAIEIAPAE